MILGVDDVATLKDTSSKHLVLFNQTSSILDDYYFPSILRIQLVDYGSHGMYDEYHHCRLIRVVTIALIGPYS